MEQFINNMLESIFGGAALQINIIVGALLVLAGVVIHITMKKRPSKAKNIAAWVCIGIGCIGALSSVAQSLFF